MKAKILKTAGLGAGIIFILAIPNIWADEAVVYFVSMVMIMSIFAIGWDLVFGVSGLLSLGHGAFFGIGAYTLTLLTVNCGVPFELALLAAGLLPAMLATLFGFLAVRLSSLFFIFTTLGVGELIHILATFKLRFITGGMDGLGGVPRPVFWGIDFYQNDNFYIYIACIFIIAFGVSALIRSSPFGQVLVGIRQNQIRAEQIGFNTKRFKLAVFVISGFYSGIAGCLLASLMFFVDSGNLSWAISFEALMMVILGGAGTLVGPVLGALTFQALSILLSSYTQYWLAVIGAIFIAYTLFMPSGMLGLGKRIWLFVLSLKKKGRDEITHIES
jgi:branched-chain amino acid transport system permease protein